MTKYEETKIAYQEIIDTINKHKELCYVDVRDVEYKMENHLFGIELAEKYGLNVKPTNIYKQQWNNVSYHKGIGYYPKPKSDKECPRISWSDDGRQPCDEYLVSISFPTGAYIFGDDYDYMQDTFKDMFAEFKSFNPKYLDTANRTLYFTLETAAEPFNRFDEIVAKYRERAKNEIRVKKAAALQRQIDELTGGGE